MFGEFNEAGRPKTSLAKYSVEFNDFAETQCLQRRLYLRLYCKANRTHITVCEKVCEQTTGLHVAPIKSVLNHA